MNLPMPVDVVYKFCLLSSRLDFYLLIDRICKIGAEGASGCGSAYSSFAPFSFEAPRDPDF